MKELSIEQKARAYDESLERAKNIYSASECKDILHTLETIFPELKESEDEKILHELSDYVKDEIHSYDSLISRDYDNRDKEDKKMHEWWKNVLAWLEKLDKKPTDCVVPHKYNVGDWIVSKYGSIYQVKTIMTGSYNLLCASNTEEINSISQVDNSSRLLCMKDIQDMLKQSKPVEWSKEDEDMLDFCCDYLDTPQATWLQTLKQRIGG